MPVVEADFEILPDDNNQRHSHEMYIIYVSSKIISNKSLRIQSPLNSSHFNSSIMIAVHDHILQLTVHDVNDHLAKEIRLFNNYSTSARWI